MLEGARIGLKVDVDTLRGTREGVPRLHGAVQEARRRCHFLFLGGPRPHGPRHAPRVSQGLRAEGRAHVGAQALRPENAAVRRAAAGPGYRPPRRATAMRSVHDAGFEVGLAYLRSRALAGLRGGADAGLDAARIRARHGGVRAGVRLLRRNRMRPPAGRSTPTALELEREYGLRYASDTRGGAAVLAAAARAASVCPQLPTTLADLR